ncbi:DNA-binding response regulator [Paenibacillus pectinilyticus]|uniref:DNA-binding response regulator n=1 Tax=Paenibacillus pectinilyticus TaxID=512399 RepID=A0A1C0ZVU1_9BACL|nr:response regulator [Paenibacillus pectinilyticus]OCT12215.1 DNA-binding response regulator [Paenibacillus pectinilyticus]
MRVLIVDDEMGIREGLHSFFPWTTYGITEVWMAEDGDTALALALEHKPELIITDMKMKRMSGLQLLDALLKEADFSWKAVVVSGYDDFEIVRQAMKLGAFDYLLKPINTSELGQVIERAISQLERERIDRHNQILLNSHVENALHKMSEELLKEIVEQEYDVYRESRIIHRLQTLHLEWIARDRITVMIIEVDDLKALDNKKGYRNEKELILFGIGNVVKQTVDEEYSQAFVSYEDVKHRWVVLLQCQDVSQWEKGKSLAMICMERIETYVKVKVSIGLCPTLVSLKQLHAGYVETGEILEQKALYGGNRLWTSHEWEEKMEPSDPSIRTSDEVMDLVRYGSDMDIVMAMDRFADLFNPSSSSHIKDVQQNIFEWLLSIFKKAVSLGWSDRSWERNPIAIWDQLEQYDTLDSLRVQVQAFLLAIADDFRKQTSSPSRLIQEAEKYIQASYGDGLTLQSVAAAIYVTPVWLSKLFKKEKQMTFLEYVTDVRMERAKKLLGDVQYKIYQIATIVGYKDPVHFAKLFKREIGLTPKEYRRLQGIDDE